MRGEIVITAIGCAVMMMVAAVAAVACFLRDDPFVALFGSFILVGGIVACTVCMRSAYDHRP